MSTTADEKGRSMIHLADYYSASDYRGNRAATAREFRRSRAAHDAIVRSNRVAFIDGEQVEPCMIDGVSL